ncbi:4Fe-4S dicluster domain-containing protein [Halorutilales archaeon Cl-col2-1]
MTSYGFVIDNRKCIGCHACTTACKAEHDVPVGVNRTWVKYIEKGEYPDTKRTFTVHRCNHCDDAPCVEICPVSALFNRDDGIVDFDKNRCIACKSCTQACPYDALYIDPETDTAAKCNYCSHRVDVGLQPSCVNVCPEHAIISGDMENPDSEISDIIEREPVQARKVEKGTEPKLFYVDGDESSVTPSATSKDTEYMWSSQAGGIGHSAGDSAPMSGDGAGAVESKTNDKKVEADGGVATSENVRDGISSTVKGSYKEITGKVRRVYDVPDEGIMWGWEVPAYVVTKAVAAGVFLMAAMMGLMGTMPFDSTASAASGIVSLVFLGLTGVLLILDLDRPERFYYTLVRPHWTSWLTRGSYIISFYGLFMTVWTVAAFLGLGSLLSVLVWPGIVLAILTAIYTAFLFAQAKGRDFWQSPLLPFHMFIHAVIAGPAALLILGVAGLSVPMGTMTTVLLAGLIANTLILGAEITVTHPTEDAAEVAHMIKSGRYSNLFWGGVMGAGNLLPIILAGYAAVSGGAFIGAVAGILALVGMYAAEQIWVEAPQLIPNA